MLSNYDKTSEGVIRQKQFVDKLKVYDVEYANVYNTYGELGNYMSHLRLGYLIGVIGFKPDRILDVGYGNGDFLKVAAAAGINCYGTDVSGYPVPDGVTYVDSMYTQDYDVVSFFDVLEHFEDIYEIKKLRTTYVQISVPECHYVSDEWFENWKHRKPDEHLWHFNKLSLNKFMRNVGFELVAYSNIEDIIRKPEDELSNILTGVFKKI